MTSLRTLAVVLAAISGAGATASLAQDPPAGQASPEAPTPETPPSAETLLAPPAPVPPAEAQPAVPPAPGAPPVVPPVAAPPAAAATAPPELFADCAACHGVTKDAPPTIGPNLWNVAGRKAGATDYPYSPAMKAYGVTWSAETLAAFIARPTEVVPGTSMAYPGVPDPAAAKAIAEYVMTLKDGSGEGASE